jgi:hypothetical protein
MEKPRHSCRVCGRFIFWSHLVHSWIHANWLNIEEDRHQAYPTNPEVVPLEEHSNDR